VIAAVILCTLLALAGICVWRWNNARNQRPEERNQVTGRGRQA
jgi:hypothetical protein